MLLISFDSMAEAQLERFERIKQALCVGLMLLGAVLFYCGMPSSWRAAINPFVVSPAATAGSTPASHTPVEKGLRTKRIEDARVGDRLLGRNPIREQAELVEPDPATWQHISLYMKKESGLGLWIELLRPLTWTEEHNARPGNTIFVDLHEMGAVGDAEVTYLGPCRTIQPGTGTVVTGTFKHQADDNTNVVHLKLEDQIELTGVTDNHPYWSADRREFVEVGKLWIGELVDTEYGLKHVVSVTPIEHNGFLYNLETTEHVYRVGSLGTLVHNSCWNDFQRGTRGVFGSRTDAAAVYGNLRTSAYAPYKVPYSHVGQCFTKHAGAQRVGSGAFPKLAGNDAVKEATARRIFEGILNDPAKTIRTVPHSKYGQVIELMSSTGQGAKFDIRGNFLYFFE